MQAVEIPRRVELEGEPGGVGVREARELLGDPGAAPPVLGLAGDHAVDQDVDPLDPVVIEGPADQGQQPAGGVAGARLAAEGPERWGRQGRERRAEQQRHRRERRLASHLLSSTLPAPRTRPESGAPPGAATPKPGGRRGV